MHAYGGLVFADVISPEQARKAVDAGADGLILVCSGAGGHTGRYSPFAFVDEVRQFWSGPLCVAGGIGGARALRAALTLGADFAYMGTRFIASPESEVCDDNRDMLVRAGMSDVVTTAAVSGVPANWMRESLDRAGFDAQMLEGKAKIDFSDLHSGGKAWKTIWGAGHGVGAIDAVEEVQVIVERLCSDYLQLEPEMSRQIGWPRPI